VPAAEARWRLSASGLRPEAGGSDCWPQPISETPRRKRTLDAKSAAAARGNVAGGGRRRCICVHVITMARPGSEQNAHAQVEGKSANAAGKRYGNGDLLIRASAGGTPAPGTAFQNWICLFPPASVRILRSLTRRSGN